MKKNVSTDPAGLDRLHNAGKLYLSPCKNLPGNRSTCYDDRFILEAAEKFNGAIVSNDDFRDLIGENPSKKNAFRREMKGYFHSFSFTDRMGQNHIRTCCWIPVL